LIDAEKWQAGKELPKRYGDRVSAEITGADGGPLQVEAAAAIRALIEALPELGVQGTVAQSELPPSYAPGAQRAGWTLGRLDRIGQHGGIGTHRPL
jgi:hypothetical protein